MSKYEDAVEKGYDGPPPGSRKGPSGCGGYAAYHGHCGATDCPTCHPGSWDMEDLEVGQECPNCRCGTLADDPEGLVCAGECGELFPS